MHKPKKDTKKDTAKQSFMQLTSSLHLRYFSSFSSSSFVYPSLHNAALYGLASLQKNLNCLSGQERQISELGLVYIQGRSRLEC